MSCMDDPNFGVVCSFLDRFGKFLVDESVSYSTLRTWIEAEEPEDVEPFVKLVIRLLRKVLQVNRPWERALVKYCKNHLAENLVALTEEVEKCGFHKCTTKTKLTILRNVLEDQFEYNAIFKTKVKETKGDLRHYPLGRDRDGWSYWCFLDDVLSLRLCRFMETEDDGCDTWETVCRDKDDLEDFIASLEDGTLTEDEADSLHQDETKADRLQKSGRQEKEDNSSAAKTLSCPNQLPNLAVTLEKLDPSVLDLAFKGPVKVSMLNDRSLYGGIHPEKSRKHKTRQGPVQTGTESLCTNDADTNIIGSVLKDRQCGESVSSDLLKDETKRSDGVHKLGEFDSSLSQPHRENNSLEKVETLTSLKQEPSEVRSAQTDETKTEDLLGSKKTVRETASVETPNGTSKPLDLAVGLDKLDFQVTDLTITGPVQVSLFNGTVEHGKVSPAKSTGDSPQKRDRKMKQGQENVKQEVCEEVSGTYTPDNVLTNGTVNHAVVDKSVRTVVSESTGKVLKGSSNQEFQAGNRSAPTCKPTVSCRGTEVHVLENGVSAGKGDDASCVADSSLNTQLHCGSQNDSGGRRKEITTGRNEHRQALVISSSQTGHNGVSETNNRGNSYHGNEHAGQLRESQAGGKMRKPQTQLGDRKSDSKESNALAQETSMDTKPYKVLTSILKPEVVSRMKNRNESQLGEKKSGQSMLSNGTSGSKERHAALYETSQKPDVALKSLLKPSVVSGMKKSNESQLGEQKSKLQTQLSDIISGSKVGNTTVQNTDKKPDIVLKPLVKSETASGLKNSSESQTAGLPPDVGDSHTVKKTSTVQGDNPTTDLHSTVMGLLKKSLNGPVKITVTHGNHATSQLIVKASQIKEELEKPKSKQEQQKCKQVSKVIYDDDSTEESESSEWEEGEEEEEEEEEDSDLSDYNYDMVSQRVRMAQHGCKDKVGRKATEENLEKYKSLPFYDGIVIDDNDDEELDSNTTVTKGRNLRLSSRRASAACQYAVSEEEEEEEEEEDLVSCSVCLKRIDPHLLLLCDDCDAEYHTYCLQPPIRSVPEGDWFCPPCSHKRLIKALRSKQQFITVQARKLRRRNMRYNGTRVTGVSADNIIGKDEQSAPGQRLRRNRKEISYTFNKFDEMLNTALKDSVIKREVRSSKRICTDSEDEDSRELNSSSSGTDDDEKSKVLRSSENRRLKISVKKRRSESFDSQGSNASSSGTDDDEKSKLIMSSKERRQKSSVKKRRSKSSDSQGSNASSSGTDNDEKSKVLRLTKERRQKSSVKKRRSKSSDSQCSNASSCGTDNDEKSKVLRSSKERRQKSSVKKRRSKSSDSQGSNASSSGTEDDEKSKVLKSSKERRQKSSVEKRKSASSVPVKRKRHRLTALEEEDSDSESEYRLSDSEASESGWDKEMDEEEKSDDPEELYVTRSGRSSASTSSRMKPALKSW